MKLSKNTTEVLVLSHFLIDPFQNVSSSTMIRKFLLDKVKKIAQIEQPFPQSRENFSSIHIYKDSKLKGHKKFRSIKDPNWLSYMIDPFVTLYFLMITFSRYDLCIACDNLSFISVLLLRKLGLIKKLIYYSVDYVEFRFQNRFLNKTYHWIDKLACQSSDENWVVAREQIAGRKENGLPIERCSSFKVVPIGFMNNEIDILSIDKIDYYNLAFCGGLRESAGPQLAILAMPYLIKRFPKISLTIIGGGEYRQNLEELAKKMNVSKRVRFLGMIVSHKKIIRILTKCSIGLAPYAPVSGSISYRSDPGKIKLYLACGLPVITTPIATTHKVITRNKAGAVVNFDGGHISEAVTYLLKNRERYMSYREGAVSLSKKYDSERIFFEAFRNL